MTGAATTRRPLLTHALTGCAGVIVGALVVSLSGQRSPTSESPTMALAGGEPLLATQVDTEALERGIRRVVREELARHGTVMAPTPAAAVVAPAVVPRAASPEVAAQAARADAVLAAAAARLTWTDEDAREFRSALAALPPAERQGLMLKFAQAVNDRGMRLETGEAPF